MRGSLASNVRDSGSALAESADSPQLLPTTQEMVRADERRLALLPRSRLKSGSELCSRDRARNA